MSNLEHTGTGSQDPGEPLSEREIALVKRLFSDPFAFPPEYYTWLKAKMESDPPLLSSAVIHGFRSTVAAIAAGATAGVEIGTIVAYAGTTDPSAEWVICDGRALDRTTYAVLFARCGTKYGVGDGSTTFNIPDGRGRGLAGVGTHADVNDLGKTDGLSVGSRTPNHQHLTNRDRAGTGSPGSEVTGETLTDPASAPFFTANWVIYIG